MPPRPGRWPPAPGVLLLVGLLILPWLCVPPVHAQDDEIDRLLAGMSTTQKVAQLFMVSLWGEVLTLDGADFLASYPPGGVILFGYNTSTPEQITRLTNDIQAAIIAQPGAVPAWIAIDQEGGPVSRLATAEANAFTAFPVSMAIAATGDPAYAQSIGLATAEELRAVGITMNLAPVADVETNPDNPVIFRRAFSADPALVGAMAAAMIRGLQEGGVLATAKHFPGHGDTSDDSHLTLPVVPHDRARLDVVELAPFGQAIAADVGAILVAHVAYPALDPAPDTPASLSAPIVSGLLRQELGFDGLIMTDALDMDAIDLRYSLAHASLLALQAGADLITPGPHVSLETQQAAIEAVVRAVEDGTLPLERIEDSVRRILRLKTQFGVLDWSPLDPATARQRINHDTHEQLVSQLLAAAVTLAYDQTGAIPLSTEQHVALIYPATLPSIARTCEAYHPALRFVGVSLGPTAEERSWAVEAARAAEIVIVFTIDAAQNPDLQALVHALPPEKTIAVALRSPYDWQQFPDIAGYMAVYTPLPAAIDAACAALFGAQPVTGVLPVNLGPALMAGSGLRLP
ncbi:MAG: hypothetical protein HPY64_07435 [Anaerolineae bacterium]|nr:hypothetical protein [Anaerolineae bacterium]